MGRMTTLGWNSSLILPPAVQDYCVIGTVWRSKSYLQAAWCKLTCSYQTRCAAPDRCCQGHWLRHRACHLLDSNHLAYLEGQSAESCLTIHPHLFEYKPKCPRTHQLWVISSIGENSSSFALSFQVPGSAVVHKTPDSVASEVGTKVRCSYCIYCSALTLALGETRSSRASPPDGAVTGMPCGKFPPAKNYCATGLFGYCRVMFFKLPQQTLLKPSSLVVANSSRPSSRSSVAARSEGLWTTQRSNEAYVRADRKEKRCFRIGKGSTDNLRPIISPVRPARQSTSLPQQVAVDHSSAYILRSKRPSNAVNAAVCPVTRAGSTCWVMSKFTFEDVVGGRSICGRWRRSRQHSFHRWDDRADGYISLTCEKQTIKR